ncbi:ATP binding domain 4 [Modicella reniformis]|uniref:Diphthine--ammonia ligase n=1 Tax=Modicella reniformis TaxID=1440133 RepID=A0A9P6LZ84_9FUNG|nr:ATP binding domain 4 [Modicella reniformis]
MKILGLISGGKDSFYNLMQCVAQGHELVALGNLHPAPQDKKDELDSYMYQTVGHDVVHLYKDCLDVPLYRREISGKPIEQGSDYVVTAQDETEDLYELLKGAKEAHPELQGLVTLAYLWQRNQEELLNEMAQAGVNAILIKVAAIGLKQQHLGRSIEDMYPYLCQMNQEYDLHICGEGGEFETITLDCPLFKRKIVVDESEIVIHADDHFAQVAYLRFKKLHLENKTVHEMNPAWISEMGLNPVWDADAIMAPIEDIVRSKQRVCEAKDGTGDQERSTINDQGQLNHRDNNQEDTLVSSRSKFTTHESDIVCAIGGTIAYESPSFGEKRLLSIADETTACLQNVQTKLEKIQLSWAEVVFMQVFVSDMRDFGAVNGAYKAFFGINPPPRACVGAHLPDSTRIQVSCTAIRKEVTSPKPRRTLHVQGMSYWAPANIGPYSQATEQAYHSFIAGQIGMIPCTLDLPNPSSLAKETAWSLRNLSQIATLRESDLVNRTALCIAYVNSSDHFASVIAAWGHIENKKTPAPVLAICMPSLPKSAQVEWQAILHYGKVYAVKEQYTKENGVEEGIWPNNGGQDGYETDDDDIYELGKRELHPTALSLLHEQPPSSSPNQYQAATTTPQWKSRTQSWFLAPLLMALSVIHVPETSSLSSMFSSLSMSSERTASSQDVNNTFTKDTLKDMITMIIKAMGQILGSHKAPAAGPGVEGGWEDVIGLTLYYCGALVQQPECLGPTLDELLSQFTTTSNIAATFVPVQAIADQGVLAMTIHAVGKMPTIPGLLQA